jgi:uncharacterized protein YqgV (UPF0045/DUF77 family)
MNKKTRLLQALAQINNVTQLIRDNGFEHYLQQHLCVVEYELQRQLSLINENERGRFQVGSTKLSNAAKQQRSQLSDSAEAD